MTFLLLLVVHFFTINYLSISPIFVLSLLYYCSLYATIVILTGKEKSCQNWPAFSLFFIEISPLDSEQVLSLIAIISLDLVLVFWLKPELVKVVDYDYVFF